MNQLEPTHSESEFNSVDDIPYGPVPMEHVKTIKGPFEIMDMPMIPYPVDDYEPVGDLDYVWPEPTETFTIRVKIESIVDGEPLPYPLDD